MALQKFEMDESWRSGGYDKADFAAIMGAAFCNGHKFFFFAGSELALWSSFVRPIPAAMQQMIDYLLA
jgi:hypothetical protein